MMESMFCVFEYLEVPFSSALAAMELAGKTFPKYLRVYRFRGNEVIKLNIVATNSKVYGYFAASQRGYMRVTKQTDSESCVVVHVQEGRRGGGLTSTSCYRVLL